VSVIYKVTFGTNLLPDFYRRLYIRRFVVEAEVVWSESDFQANLWAINNDYSQFSRLFDAAWFFLDTRCCSYIPRPISWHPSAVCSSQSRPLSDFHISQTPPDNIIIKSCPQRLFHALNMPNSPTHESFVPRIKKTKKYTVLLLIGITINYPIEGASRINTTHTDHSRHYH